MRGPRFRWPSAFIGMAAALWLIPAQAQVPVAELDALMPAGAQAGSTAVVTPTGTYLHELSDVWVSDPEVEASVEDGKVRFEVPEGLSPRVIDVAVRGRFGLSNPRAFFIGSLPEIMESGDHSRREAAQTVSVGQVINGTVDAAAVDWYVVRPETTAPFVLDIRAERIDSRMDPTVILMDAKGRELDRFHDVRGRDIRARVTPEVAGEPLFVGVHDFLFEGGAAYFYRLTLADEPVRVPGAVRSPSDLPAAEARDLADDVPRRYEAGIALGELPAWVEGDCARGSEHVVEWTLEDGGEVVLEVYSERLDDPSDFRLQVEQVGEDGQAKRVAESDDQPDPVGDAHFRLGTRDPVVRLGTEAGGLYRARLTNQFGTGGRYRLQLRRPEPEAILIAAAARPRELNNQMSRWVPVLRRGESVHWEILVLRRDGYPGAIAVEAEGLPAGVKAAPLVVGPEENRGVLVVTAGDEAEPFAGPVSIVGRYEVGDEAREVQARGATLLWSIGDRNRERWESRVTASPLLSVTPQDEAPVTLVPAVERLETARGAQLSVTFAVKRSVEQTGNFKVVLDGLPGLAKSPEAVFDPQAETVALTLDLVDKDGNRFKPGTFGLHARGWEGKVKYRANPEAAERAEKERQEREAEAQRLTEALAALREKGATEGEIADAEKGVQAATEAKEAAAKRAEEAKQRAEPKEVDHALISSPVMVEIGEAPIRWAGESLGERQLRPGGSVEMKVALERLYGFAGPVALRLEAPGDPALFEPVTLEMAADVSEAVLPVTISETAAPGRHEIRLDAQLTFNGQELTLKRTLPCTVTAATPDPS